MVKKILPDAVTLLFLALGQRRNARQWHLTYIYAHSHRRMLGKKNRRDLWQTIFSNNEQ